MMNQAKQKYSFREFVEVRTRSFELTRIMRLPSLTHPIALCAIPFLKKVDAEKAAALPMD